MSIDGDDHLIGKHVFGMVNEVYRSGEVWACTSQTFAEKENNIWISHFPKEGLQHEHVRDYFYGHLKTFLVGLFKKIKLESFISPETNEFYRVATDRAIMYPLV